MELELINVYLIMVENLKMTREKKYPVLTIDNIDLERLMSQPGQIMPSMPQPSIQPIWIGGGSSPSTSPIYWSYTTSSGSGGSAISTYSPSFTVEDEVQRLNTTAFVGFNTPAGVR
jgi:hypothetical protein